MTKTAATPLNYETLSRQLDEVLARLQHPDVPVDEAMQLYKEGLVLIDALEQHLKQAENKIEKLKLKAAAHG